MQALPADSSRQIDACPVTRQHRAFRQNSLLWACAWPCLHMEGCMPGSCMHLDLGLCTWPPDGSCAGGHTRTWLQWEWRPWCSLSQLQATRWMHPPGSRSSRHASVQLLCQHSRPCGSRSGAGGQCLACWLHAWMQCLRLVHALHPPNILRLHVDAGHGLMSMSGMGPALVQASSIGRHCP